MMTNLFDYEMLARQKRETMQTEAVQRHLADKLTEGQRLGLMTRIRAFRARFGAAERQAVAPRTA